MTLKQKSEKYDCADIERLVQKYIDSGLNDHEKQLFEEHLEYCLPCDKKVSFELKLKSIIRHKMSHEVPPENLKNKISNLLEHLE
ncbi:MAG: zf-HC2 domain-containing protein [Calditrichaceae bacterium]|nr:zf-HC2 domain-containing protein [Calditrichaceae bacterium]MBN2710436.1 zf-HC2 domain-containing protein [Calditrichaceae bacterium]RQV93627.1 MAG: hypothetical protein EH224_12200 [Calditrichota bacterium]